MKKPIVFFLFLFVLENFYSQVKVDSLKAGVYLSYDEYKSKTPAMTCDFEVKKRSKFSIVMCGGNDYKIKCDALSRKEINKEIWGFYDGKNFYINCYLFSLIKKYAVFESESENEIYFYAAIGPDKEMMEAAALGGLIGGTIMGIKASKRVKYIFYKRTGGIFAIGKP